MFKLWRNAAFTLPPKAARRVLPWLWLAVCTGTFAETAPYYASYELVKDSPSVDVGIQPLGYPSGVLTATLRHDGILREKLTSLGHSLQLHPFRRGADMLNLLADNRLEAGLLGDMPTLLAAAQGHIVIVGLAKQSPTAIVAGRQTTLKDLRGKRIAFVEASSAHQTLLQGLFAAGLSESDVRLVPLGVEKMPGALKRGEIDAFAAWEPAPSLALADDPGNRVVFRGISSDYFVVSSHFAERSPAAVDALVAAYIRAFEWLRLSQKNLERAARWAQGEAKSFSGEASDLPLAKIADITRRDIINIPSAPSIIHNTKGSPPLFGEFEFLKRLGKLPVNADWQLVTKAVNSDVLSRVVTHPRQHETSRFDYRD